MQTNNSGLYSALNDFRSARRKAKLQLLLSGLSGKKRELLSFQEVQRLTKLSGLNRRYQADIPLDAIVGSVGRYQDFDEKFFPLDDSDAHRWAGVRRAQETIGLPPIEVYKISEVYFVLDGHHRVSIARQMGAPSIDAYVQEFKSNINITRDDDIEDVFLKAEKSAFFEGTNLDRDYPGYDLEFTLPGRYRELFEHIRVHQYYLGLEKHKDVPLKEAVNSWMENVYIPAVRAIRLTGILRDFPGRTETDLYLWLKKYQAELSDALDWNIDAEQAARHLTRKSRSKWGNTRLNPYVDSSLSFSEIELDNENLPAEWRKQLTERKDDNLFNAILVGLSGAETGWLAFEQAVYLAKHEGAILRGLHVVPQDKDRTSMRVRSIREEFYTRCEEKGIKGEFAVESGDVAQNIVQRAVWVDLVVLHLGHPPGPLPWDRLRSGFSTVLNYCPRPVLVVPSATRQIDTILTAYDGSPKSEEALFLSSYLSREWNITMVVINVEEENKTETDVLDSAKEYLRKNKVNAEYVTAQGAVSEAIMAAADTCQANLIIMGGYGVNPNIHRVVGSTVDHILRANKYPVMICQ